MTKIIALIISLLSFHLLVINANATQLLGSWGGSASMGSAGVDYNQGQFESASVFFYLQFQDSPPPLISPPLKSGDSGMFQYDASSAPEFMVFVQHLTNNVDEIFLSGQTLIDSNGVIQAGGAEGHQESNDFRPFEILANWQPEFVRLYVDNLAIAETSRLLQVSANEWRLVYGVWVDYQARWEIWGDGTPSSVPGPGTNPVPEPPTLALLALGLAGLASWGQRKTT